MPLFSIIVPVYNSELYIAKTLETLKNQSFDDFEVIIVNDGSIDGSEKICQQFTEDKRFRYYKILNHGVSYARNFGIDRAEGKWIMFIDSDDKYYPNLLSNIAQNIMANSKLEFLCFGYEAIYKGKRARECTLDDRDFNSEQICEALEELYERRCFNVVWNKVFKKEILDRFGIRMKENLWIGEDFIFVLEYLYCVKWVRMISYVGYQYTTDSNGLTKKKRENELNARLEQEKKLEQFILDHGKKNIRFVKHAYIKIAMDYLQRVISSNESYRDAFEECVDNEILDDTYNYLKDEKTIYSLLSFLIKHKQRTLLYLGIIVRKHFQRIDRNGNT